MTNIFFNYCDIQFIYLLIFCLFVFLTNRSYGTLSTGFVYRPEKAALLLEGGNQEFYKLIILLAPMLENLGMAENSLRASFIVQTFGSISKPLNF